MNNEMKSKPVDLRARLPRWLDDELKARAARREKSKRAKIDATWGGLD